MNTEEFRCEVCGRVVGSMSQEAWEKMDRVCEDHAEKEE